MDFAEAANKMADEVAEIIAKAERRGLTKREIVDELRRIADELEGE